MCFCTGKESNFWCVSFRSVLIPMSEEERKSLPGETDILQSYDKLLKRKSSVHFGYPYNLMYNHSELYEFMKYRCVGLHSVS